MPLSPEDEAKLNISRFEQWHRVAHGRAELVGQVGLLVQRQLMILNGGAVIAIFTLLGHVDIIKISGHNLWWGFAFFVLSMTMTFISIGSTFFAQNLFLQNDWIFTESIYASLVNNEQHIPWPTPAASKLHKRGNRVRTVAQISAAIAAIFFFAGAWTTLIGVEMVGKTVPDTHSAGQMGAASSKVRTRYTIVSPPPNR